MHTAALNAAQRRTSSASESSQTGRPIRRPVFTASAMPFLELELGQRLERSRIDHDPGGPVERADEVLAAREIDRRLAPDRRIDLADERRRHRHPRHATHVRRRREPGEVGGAAAAEPDDGAVPPDPQGAPEPLQDGDRLRRLAGRNLVQCDVAIAERELGRDAVNAGDVRVGDDLDCAVARHELLEQVDRTDPNVDRSGGEDDPVRVVGVRMRVRDLLVDREPVAEERVERFVVDRQRAPTLPGPLPGGLRVDLEQHGECAPREQLPRVGGEDGAAAERDHRGLRPVEYRTRQPRPRSAGIPTRRPARRCSSIVVPVSRSIS